VLRQTERQDTVDIPRQLRDLGGLLRNPMYDFIQCCLDVIAAECGIPVTARNRIAASEYNSAQ